MKYVIVDTEYTTWPGALESGWSGPGQHREIIQIAAIRVSEDFQEEDHFNILVRPTINPSLSDLCIDLTGITQAMIDKDGLPFEKALFQFEDFSAGEDGSCGDHLICMNADQAVFLENCGLNNLDYLDFPFAPWRKWHRLRPFLEAQGIDLTHLSSGDLHKLTPAPLVGMTHNALHDVRSMACWLRYALQSDVYRSLDQMPTSIPDRDPRSLKPLS